MLNDKLTGPQKAAIFLFSIGEELASTIVKRLDEDEIKKLGGSMAKVFSVSPKHLENIFTQFNELASNQLSIQIGHSEGTQFIKNVVNKSVDKGKAEAILEQIEEGGKWNLFQKIRQLDPHTVVNFIGSEHPQTIAIILSYLSTTQSAAILGELPESLQSEVVFRIAELGNVPLEIVEEINQVVEEGISAIKGIEGRQRGGVHLVAEILNQVDGSMEGNILKGIEEQKQTLAEDIRKLMFVFEDLVQVDDKSIMAILKEVNNEALMAAMKTASDALKEKVFKNMSERAAQMMREDLEVMGPIRLKDVEAAQQSILRIAKKLEGEGKIVLMGKGKEEVFV
jgi:flagellar motor switch protein FliG